MDEQFIKETLRLAKKGIGQTNPNPMVGAVIVKGGKIIGKGYHRRIGLPHAEIEAITYARRGSFGMSPQGRRLASLKGATLYVNLEPCVHFGKTPPCVDAIIQSSVKRVVCSTKDPNPKVHGRGLEKLKQAGIAVSVGILEDEARSLNEAFFTFHEKKRPFIAIKFASSLDGKMATRSGDSKWITNKKARNFAKKIRNQYQAVLVGINTVLKDDPNLGNGLRIILDSALKIPIDSSVLRDTNVLIATTGSANKEKLKTLKKLGIHPIKFRGKQVPLKKFLSKLYEREIISIFVEGGVTVHGSFLSEALVDKVYAFYAPILIGEAKTLNQAIHLNNASLKRFDDNFLIT